MNEERKGVWRILAVDEDGFIGCRACSSLWPEISTSLSLSERGPERTVRFPRIFGESETKIAGGLEKVCPVGAISIISPGEIPGEDSFSLVFDMVRCPRCRAPFATGKELDYVKGKLPEDIRAESSYPSWIDLCPTCRRSAFREGASREVIVRRSGARR